MIYINKHVEKDISDRLAQLAVEALIDEAMLTPKPGLVDQKSSGAHNDMSIQLMIRSANSLLTTFVKMAEISKKLSPGVLLREKLAEIGRYGEQMMFQATGGINTHKGAIWALGLLTAAAAIHGPKASPHQIAETAGLIARFPDQYSPVNPTNGKKVSALYGVQGALGEAQNGFPHVIDIALPALWNARKREIPETSARIDALLALISELDDTCILHRGGLDALILAKQGAKRILRLGGASTTKGYGALLELDRQFILYNISPGGSADLLAAALFLDRLHITS